MKTAIFLSFEEQVEQAIAFYEKVFQTKCKSQFRLSEAPEGQVLEGKDPIIWAEIQIGDLRLFLEDLGYFNRPALPLSPKNSYSRQWISLSLENKEEAERIFSALAENGQIVYELKEVFFSPLYGRLIDGFGIAWEIML